ncbi:NADPH:quinone reductase [Ureibacillus acetophenoni]|uniref:NADPH:quinone reductase-like Zn-dependent oxidoreductase n=1 Tax=Ureibacillus acetophenoni TaxID=614649 RepID=A0A285URW1_9BACL|nr:NADPH:quinone reductase [Ureibacillus acetophenoni]SOC44513.1 NADPH:quinone reductase-like Zn-dependent oxidoreductase [Ureibacillus acetophenoni]
MKAIQVTQFGGPEQLVYKDIEDVVVGKGEVCVRLYAAGVNPSDTYTLTGTYAFSIPELPYTPGLDGAGIVEAVGEGVTNVQIGDRVFVASLNRGKSTGTFAQKIVCDPSFVHPLPEQVSFEQGAALGVPALTAYRALFQRARIKPGQWVLIHGASGGVGLQAVQMAKAHGAKVIGTASKPEGKSLVEQAGADVVIDHVTEATIEEVLALTDGNGPDVIVEFLANVNLETDLKMVARFGTIVVIGNRGSIEINPRLAMQKECDILATALWNAPEDEYKESIHGVIGMLESGALRPIIGTSLPLEQASQAFEQVANGVGNGKLVLTIE